MNGHTNLAIFDRTIPELSVVRVVTLIGAPGHGHRHKRSSREPRRHHM
nr:hypothetical protein [Ensifer sp.]